MLKRPITYEDFNGDTVTEEFYFNLTKSEIIELEVDMEGGLSDWLAKIVKTENHKEIVGQFKRIVLLAYGEKSPDGRRFIKTDQMREEFAQTAAYNALFMELATNDNAAAEFITGIMPKDMQGEVEKSVQEEIEAAKAPEPTQSA